MAKVNHPCLPRSPASVEVYRGPSLIDGSPIVAILTGLRRKSSNAKTGAMLQLWILRADMTPLRAVQLGMDTGVCGACQLRGTIAPSGLPEKGTRGCYVEVAKAPQSVYHGWQRGNVARFDLASTGDLALLGHALRGRQVRLGAYGDPAALPVAVLGALVDRAAGHTGYTHQWREGLAVAAWLMASCETPADVARAGALGYRCFVTHGAAEPRRPGHMVCPASEEGIAARAARGAAPLQCADCGACGGRSVGAQAHVQIRLHGAAARRVDSSHVAA